MFRYRAPAVWLGVVFLRVHLAIGCGSPHRGESDRLPFVEYTAMDYRVGSSYEQSDVPQH